MSVELSLESRKKIAENIRLLRDKKGLSQLQVAKAVGISTNHYSGIERAEENLGTGIIEKLCKVFGVKSSKILPF